MRRRRVFAQSRSKAHCQCKKRFDDRRLGGANEHALHIEQLSQPFGLVADGKLRQSWREQRVCAVVEFV